MLCVSRLLAQVNPPDLRCLEVLSNGNVKLTWIPPADPGNFYSYQIYTGISLTAPFTALNPNITSIATNTYVHATGAGTAQNVYYYMEMRYGTGGTNVTQHSATLSTIFLTGLPDLTNGTQDIEHNYICSPKLPSSASTYTLYKEFPLGTWKTLSVSSQTLYPDTITTCKDTANPLATRMNYQVSLADNSGCFSISNLLIANYIDHRQPERPYVDSISVLPDGTTTLAWEVPVDKDIESYNIQYDAGGTHQLIDQVPGRNTTHYTYTTTTANANSIGVWVQAVDTCGNVSTVNYLVHTMFVRSTYDHCAYQTSLNWNHYIWSDINGIPVETTGKYKIYYSVNGSAFSVVGETTDTNFVHKGVDPGKNVCYFVRVVNQKQTITASSNRTCFFSDQTNIPHYVYIKTASVQDDHSNLVKMYIDNTQSSKGISVQRSEDGLNFIPIGFIATNGNADYEYVDEGVKPMNKSYFYKVFIHDSCGNQRTASNTCKTILLHVHEDESQIFTKQLSWSEYQGFGGGVSGYNVYRVIDDQVAPYPVGSTDPLTLTYTDNIEDAGQQGASIKYMVQAVEGISNPYGIKEQSNSNQVPVYMEGSIYVPNAFVPSGVNSKWKPITYFIDKNEYRVVVFNRWGHKVFETRNDSDTWDGNNCPADVYVYLIDFKNARGEYQQVKGTITLVR